MKTWKALLLGMVFATLPLVASAQLSYVTNNNAITITNYNIAGGSVVAIPPITNGYPVTSVGAGAFDGLGITSVTVPGSVTNIGSSAFYSCTSLTNLTLAGGLASIGVLPPLCYAAACPPLHCPTP